MLTFLKTKLLNQTTAFLSPFILLIGVFLIWNSDLILTSMGYETRSNLKAQVVSLQEKVDKLEKENINLKRDIADLIATNSIVDQTVDVYHESKQQSQATVEELIRKRNEVSSQSCFSETDEIVTLQRPQTQRVVVKAQNVNPAVSRANIAIIHEAYSSFFPES